MSLETLRAESKKTLRRPVAKVRITWTDPLIDLSLNTSATEENRAAHTIQVADNVEDVPRKWFHTNHTLVTLDGTFYPMPGTLLDARKSQVGWWGTQNSDGTTGSFPAGSEPTLTLSFSRRYVKEVTVSGDSAYGEYPVDYTVTMYETIAGVYTAVEQITVTGNTDGARTDQFVTPSFNATRIELEVSKWSRTGTVVKVAEFYSDVIEEFTTDDILALNILQEFEGSEGTLPVGNISCNELDLNMQNLTDRFYSENTGSDIYTLIRRNRKIEPFLGFRYPGGVEEYIPLGLYWSGDWATSELDTGAQTTARDRFELMRKTEFPISAVESIQGERVSLHEILTLVLAELEGYMYDLFYDIDSLNNSPNVRYFDSEIFADSSYFDVLKLIVAAGLAYAYMDTPTDEEITANGPLCKDILRVRNLDEVFPSGVFPEDAIPITKDDYINRSQPADTESMANVIVVPYTVYTDGEAEEFTYTKRDEDSISEYGVMTFEYDSNELVQTEREAEAIALSLLESFVVPKRDVEVETFGDITLKLTDQVQVPEYQKGGVDKRGIFALRRISAEFDGSLRIMLNGRKLADDNSLVEYEARGVLAQPSISGLSGELSFPSLRGDNGAQDISGVAVEPATIGREADTYEVPDSANTPPVFTLHPQDVQVASGGTAVFTAVASGTPTPTLQWRISRAISEYRNGVSGHDYVASEWPKTQGDASVTYNAQSIRVGYSASSLTAIIGTVQGGLEYGKQVLKVIEQNVPGSSNPITSIFYASNTAFTSRVTIQYIESSNEVKLDTVVGGTVTNSVSLTTTLPTDISNHTFTTTVTGDGANALIEIVLVDSLGAEVFSYSNTLINAIDTAANYGGVLSTRGIGFEVFEISYQGVGWPDTTNLPYEVLVGETSGTLSRPNIGTTGDTFGTKYDCVATNAAGTATSNEATVTETP